MLERDVEKYLVKKIKELGGMCPKWVSPGLRGVPDRIVILKDKIVFVETKRPEGVLAEAQAIRAKQIRTLGHKVYTAYSIEEVKRLIDELQFEGRR